MLKKELKFLFALFMLIGLFAGCSDEVTRPQIEPVSDLFTVDATATPMVAKVGDWVVFHADKRDGVLPYQGDYWYFRDQNVWVGEECYRQMDAEGFFTMVVNSYDAFGTIACDSVTVTVLPAEVEPLTVDLTPSEQVVLVGEYAHFSADARGGAGRSKTYEFYNAENNIVGSGGDHFTRYMDQMGIFFYHVVVTDSLGTTATDSAKVTVVAPNVIETCLDLDLKVGPYDRDDDEEVNLFQDGESNATIDLTCDTSDRRIMFLTLRYSDGIESNFPIPDLGSARPSTARVYLGEVRRIPIVSISLRWTGSPSKSVDKCTNWNSVTRICLSTEGPTKSLDGMPIICLGKDGNYTILE